MPLPLPALFILFNVVVHNPANPGNKSNLSLLGVAAGYFCRLEYSSGGFLPSSIMSGFPNMARTYIKDLKSEPGDDIEQTLGVNLSPRNHSVLDSDLQSLPQSTSVILQNSSFLPRKNNRCC